jgi:hypothetical protein
MIQKIILFYKLSKFVIPYTLFFILNYYYNNFSRFNKNDLVIKGFIFYKDLGVRLESQKKQKKVLDRSKVSANFNELVFVFRK